MSCVIYVFADPGVPGACKIGKDTRWPYRYKQARCHTPRPIAIEGVFTFDDKDALGAAEKRIRQVLGGCRRPGDVNEWFDLPAAEAIARLQKAGILGSRNLREAMAPRLSRSGLLYDDWREQGKASQNYRWLIAMFEEQSPERRLKLSYGALHDTAFLYAFTYNPWPVRLVAGFEHGRAVAAEDPGNVEPNRLLKQAWEEVQRQFGSLQSEQVGWLNQGVTSGEVARRLAALDVHPFPLDRPKPPGARLRDASIKKSTAIGEPQPLGRVSPCPVIYGAAGGRAA
ncbi:GIY-YIG nuclease family protein [Marinimicrococcus flavescens]|uniref:GIY-YIG nuclease family protein n=1 Tax=Marinimicrococcus flavescens TaxID=3031815 RepID=A0AAP3XQJ3_9PROT|nr:GIY-YIG nuclease family protein [Marinimicrococcus flavescens]